MAGTNKHNEYNLMIPDIYGRTPKAVFAAMVVSEYFNRLNIEPDKLSEAILAEWKILYENGIVPQKPPTIY